MPGSDLVKDMRGVLLKASQKTVVDNVQLLKAILHVFPQVTPNATLFAVAARMHQKRASKEASGL